MTLPMARPWKHPKTGVYWLRKRVPDALRAVVGKREEKLTLGTKDPVEAKERFAEKLRHIDAKWRHLRLGKVELTEAQAHQLARPVYEGWFNIWKEKPSEQRSWNVEMGVPAIWDLRPISDSQIHLFHWFDMRDQIQENAKAKADELLEAAGLKVDDKSRMRVAVAVTAALQRASVDLAKLANGDFSQMTAVVTAKPITPARSSIAFQDIVDEWELEKQPADRTVYEWGRVIAEFKKFLGHDDPSRVTSADLNRWKAELIGRGLQPKTIRDAKLAPVRAIFQCAVDNEKLNDNPASRIVVDVKTRSATRKRSFTEEEATLLLQRARAEKSNAVLRWVPWLCAYTGARVAEICNLRKHDVLKVEGFWCLRISPDAGPLKTLSSERVVPIHTALIDEGILKFVDETPDGPLFASLSPTSFGSRGGNGTKMVGRWVRALGITDLRISPNHSWRHRFKTQSRRFALSSDLVDALVGHHRRSVADGYGEFPIEALQREIEKIRPLSL